MIEVNGVIYRNLEEQVQKNKADIEYLQNQQSGDDSDIEQINNRLTEVETNLTEITPDVMRALKTPISAPNETKIVTVDNTNSQEMIGIGTGLIIENNKLKSTGGTEIIDNLTSSSISAGLSANQGRVLDGKISSLETLVGTKANQSSLNTTNQNVSQNSSKISSLETLVGTNITDIGNLETQISNLQSQKADQSSLNTTNQNVSQNSSKISLLETSVETKANLNAENLTSENIKTWKDKFGLNNLTPLWTGTITSTRRIPLETINSFLDYKVIYVEARTAGNDYILQTFNPKFLDSGNTCQVLANTASNNRYFKFTGLYADSTWNLSIQEVESLTLIGVYV